MKSLWRLCFPLLQMLKATRNKGQAGIGRITVQPMVSNPWTTPSNEKKDSVSGKYYHPSYDILPNVQRGDNQKLSTCQPVTNNWTNHLLDRTDLPGKWAPESRKGLSRAQRHRRVEYSITFHVIGFRFGVFYACSVSLRPHGLHLYDLGPIWL